MGSGEEPCCLVGKKKKTKEGKKKGAGGNKVGEEAEWGCGEDGCIAISPTLNALRWSTTTQLFGEQFEA